jgi:hypothetical protein
MVESAHGGRDCGLSNLAAINNQRGQPNRFLAVEGEESLSPTMYVMDGAAYLDDAGYGKH